MRFLFSFLAFGSGITKQDAKNSAAKTLLEKLMNKKYFGNMVGKLQEYCIARRWPLPIYENEMHIICTKNEHDFVMSCTVLNYKQYGQGKNKKIAKMFAAYKLWMKLSTELRLP